MVTILRIRDGSSDPWGKLLVGGDKLILEMSLLFRGKGVFGLRGSENTEDP